jgi:hypothetical protein
MGGFAFNLGYIQWFHHYECFQGFLCDQWIYYWGCGTRVKAVLRDVSQHYFCVCLDRLWTTIDYKSDSEGGNPAETGTGHLLNKVRNVIATCSVMKLESHFSFRFLKLTLLSLLIAVFEGILSAVCKLYSTEDDTAMIYVVRRPRN